MFSTSASYSVQNDIDLQGSETNKWEPLGAFEGKLEGNGYKISNLYMNFTEGAKGMFSSNAGMIRNIVIKDCNVKIGYSSGIICGTNNGTIENIKTYGEVEATSTSAGGSSIGAICGTNGGNGKIFKVYNYATITGKQAIAGGICAQNRGEIKHCVNEGRICKTGGIVGGITGNNYNIIEECVNTGDISSNENYTWNEGGICGSNYGKIQSCYNLGNLGTEGLQERWIGGISGTNQENGEVTNCYSIAEITGGYLGGIVSTNLGKIINCWYVKKGNYDIQLSTSTGTVESSGEKTESEMKENAFLDLLNTGNDEVVWKIDSRKNNGYPYLAWEDE